MQPVVVLTGLTKAYPGVVALASVDLEIYAGEAHAIVGLNGAGKSTLVRLLAGITRPDSGTIESPTGTAASVRTVPQDIHLVPEMSVGRNVLLGREDRLVRRRLTKAERARVSSCLERLGLDVDPEAPTSRCSPHELRMLQIAKALVDPGDVLLLDEPTAALPEADAARVVETVGALRDQGEAVVYVSHRIGEVLRLADRITVLRDGRKVATFLRGEIDREGVIEVLTKNVTMESSREAGAPSSEPKVVLTSFTASGCAPFDLVVNGGEIVALVGVQDAGQSEVVRTLAGLLPLVSGAVEVDGLVPDISSPGHATKAGLMLVPADRRATGIVPQLDVRKNIALSPRSATRRVIRDRAKERQTAADYLKRFSIKAPSVDTEVEILSGGNQQKVALAKTIEARPRVLLLDEPTQGIDVAAKREVLARIKEEARASGRPVIAASSELEEIPDWADTVLVFRQGQVVANLEGAKASEDQLLKLAVP